MLAFQATMPSESILQGSLRVNFPRSQHFPVNVLRIHAGFQKMFSLRQWKMIFSGYSGHHIQEKWKIISPCYLCGFNDPFANNLAAAATFSVILVIFTKIDSSSFVQTA